MIARDLLFAWWAAYDPDGALERALEFDRHPLLEDVSRGNGNMRTDTIYCENIAICVSS
ncbi:MAG: hypothetical protein ACI8T1_001972 [Verrucomicrobiales bacterium]|jgi:hypothetical protein